MALRTSLVLSGDASGANAALDSLDQNMGAVSAEAEKMAAAYDKVDRAIDRLGKAQSEAAIETQKIKAAFGAAEITFEEYNRRLLETNTALNLVKSQHQSAVGALKQAQSAIGEAGVSAGQARAGYQNLGRQIQDVAVQLQGGANIGTIISQQGGQVADAVSQMGGRFGSFAAFLAGPWGAAIIMAVSAIANLAQSMWSAGDAADEHKKASEDLAKAIDAVVQSSNRAARSTEASIRLEIQQANALRTTAKEAYNQANAQWALAKAKAAAAGASISPGAPGYSNTFNLGEQAKQEALARTAKAEMDKNDAAMRGLDGAIRQKVGTIAQMDVRAKLDGSAAATLKYDRALDQLNERLRVGTISEAQYRSALERAMRTRDAEADAAQKAARAHDRNSGAKGAAARASREAERAAERHAKAEEQLSVAIARGNYAFEQRMGRLADQTTLLPASTLGFEAPKPLTIAEQIAQDNAKALSQLPDITGRWNAELDASIERLEKIGGLGQTIAGLSKALLRGDVSGLPGATGAAVKTLFSMPAGTAQIGGRDVSVTLGQRIEQIFDGENSKFGKTMKAVLQGGSTGLAFSTAIFGQSGNNFGAMAGGALGDKFGEQFLSSGLSKISKGLGDFAGPIGSIVGGLIGGALGSLFTSKPRGSGTVTQDSVTSTANNGQIKATLDSMGLGIQQAIAKVAGSLGGTVGRYAVGIGNYKGQYYQVSSNANDPFLGQAEYSKKSGQDVYDGTDGAAALRAALSVAISQGAVQGLSAKVAAALKSSTDIDQALSEAMKVQDLEYAVDGVAGAMRKEIRAFENTAKERIDLAKKYGFDLLAVEKLNAAERLKLEEKLQDQQIGSLKQLIEDMTSGSMFEGSAIDRRQALLDQIATTKAEADKGVEGAADKLANLLGQFNDVSKAAYGTTDAFAADRTAILDAARDAIAKANQRLADAKAAAQSDPALEQTNAALDENNNQNAQMIALLQSLGANLSGLGRGSVNYAALARMAAV